MSIVERDGDQVVKRLATDHPAGAGFPQAMAAVGPDGLATYLRTLAGAGVRLVPGLRVVDQGPELAVAHRWVPGPVLLDAAEDATMFVDAVVQIAGWVRALEETDARLDTNLANFCLTPAGRVVLVDVLPPLVPSARPVPHGPFGQLFDALCFQTPVTLDALVGYAARALLRADTPVPADQVARLARLRTGPPAAPTPFAAEWFRSRAVLALRGLTGQVPAHTVHDYFAATSVLGFAALTPDQQAARVAHVDQMIKELSL
ncbi:MAG TPA: hypothetical protein VK038_11030 [Ornithinicoccus sp.]|nr:hypothetical protein [Ornithinicoccus sp.]